MTSAYGSAEVSGQRADPGRAEAAGVPWGAPLVGGGPPRGRPPRTAAARAAG
ncbi:hypothetical protein [Streptomyces sp. NPDC003090]|uniref:hypothetical protein n=1 Tax=Streptomyces sp. NPDC003090 TaxID=3154274 RepID=UPI00381C8723